MVSGSPIYSIVLRYLTGRTGFTRVVTGFSVVGIMLGVAALIVVMTVMNGFRDELLTRILGLSGHGTVYAQGLEMDLASDFQVQLERLPEITEAVPFVAGQGMALSSRGAAGGFVRGMQRADVPVIIQENLSAGDLTKFSTANSVVLGNRMADLLGVGVGDRVTLVSPDGAQTVVGFIPRLIPLKVVAIFNVGMHQFDEGLILTNMPTAQKFYKLGQRVTGLDVRVEDAQRIDAAVPDILKVAAGNIPGRVRVVTWQETNREFFGALQVERVAMFIILSLIVVVAAFNIITGQMMLVGDKRADIGILRTLGASAADIQRIFLLNGLVLGGVGTLAGLGLGLLVVWQLTNIISGIEAMTGASIFSGEAYFLDEIPQSLVWGDVGMIVVIAVILTLLASFFPARRAAKLNIVETLRD